MAFELFQNTLTTLRAVHIPPDLADDKRAAFVKGIETAVQQQAALAESCDCVLRLVGRVREENDTLVVEHEPATPFDLDTLRSADERPDAATLWWITWSALRALAAVEPRRTIHGGLQLRSLFVDRLGRVKLTDFGLASAVEIVCGREARRRVVCDAARAHEMVERGLSGSWALLDEDAEREDGWIAPYFAPEILAGGLRLNPTADQFALGVVLYQIATGVHPLGAELSDPELFGYIVPEPYPLEDERRDWAEAFERQDQDAAIRADRPVLAWAALVYRLLANESGERFASFAAAEEAARQHVPATWQEALKVLGESEELLAQEQYDPFLTSVAPWCENEELPTLWRARLAVSIAQVEKIKAIAAARRAVQARLEKGYAALDSGQLEEARAIAREVADSPHADNELRERVAELERFCDEHEQLIRQRADELARVNLESAREALERGEFPEARLILTGLRDDPLTGDARREEAETLLADIDEREARCVKQHAEFEAVKSEFVEGNVTAAWTRLTKLLEDSLLLESIRHDAETFFEEVEAAKRRHDECLQIIDEVEAALARGELAAAEETLAMLPFDSREPQIIERRSELTESCYQLRHVLERWDAAEEQLRKGEAEAALGGARQLLEEELSPTVRAQVTDLVARCERVIEQIQQVQVDDALESLAQAEKAFHAGDIEQFRRLLSTVLPLADRFEDADRARAAHLGTVRTLYEEAATRIETAERRLVQQEFDAALAELDAIETQDLPAVVTERIAELRGRSEQAREEYQRRRAQELTTWLEQVAAHLARSDVDRADALLRKGEIPPDAARELHDRYERLRADTIRGRRILTSLAAVEAALRDGTPDQAARLLDKLRVSGEEDGAPAALPAWAVEKTDELRRRVTELEEAQRLRAVQAAEAALQEARRALEAVDHAGAVKHLAAAKASVDLSPELKAAYDEVAQAAAELEAWLPKLASVATALKQDQIAVAYRDTVALLKQSPIPVPVETRLRAMESQARAKAAAHRGALSAQLQTLASELGRRGRRAKAFEQRVETIASDALATNEQQAKAAELVQQFHALPHPRRAALPIAVSAAVVVIVVGVVWHVIRTQKPAREITVASERIGRTYADALAEARAAGRTPRDWEFRFEPGNAFKTTLIATSGPEELILATEVAADEIGTLDLSDAMLERLLGPPWPPLDAEKIAAALERIERTYADALAEALVAGRVPGNWEFRFEPDNAFTTTLIANDEAVELAVARGVAAREIGALDLSDAVLERLLGSPWPPPGAEKIAAALTRVEDAYKEEVEQGRAPTGWQFSFEPNDSFDTAFSARHESGASVPLVPSVKGVEIGEFRLTSEMIDRLVRSELKPAWPAALAARSLPAPSAETLFSLLSSAAPASAVTRPHPPLSVLAGIVAQAVVTERSPEDSFTIRLDLKGGAAPVSEGFTMEARAGEWRPADGNAARLRGLLAQAVLGAQDRVETVAEDIDRHYLEGKLDAAYQAYGRAEELQAAFGLPQLAEAVAKLNRAIERFPPAWRNPGGYAESEQREVDSGYPQFLQKEGRRLLLVNVAPSDPLWNDIDVASRATTITRNDAGYLLSEEAGKPPAERKWYVFYIDAEEWAEPVERDARRFAQQRLGNDLPTVEEWLLAAWRLRREPDARGFFGGAWEWCLNNGRLWVCGGCDRIHKEYLPWPGEAAEPAEVWEWLNNPLVSQPRTRGDGLAGVRTVLRLGS